MPLTRAARRLSERQSISSAVSSPDPLTVSYTEEGIVTASAKKMPPLRSPAKDVSPNKSALKQRQKANIQTPTKGQHEARQVITLHTPSTGVTKESPWKIKVTVEAEPNHQGSARKRKQTASVSRTTTTIVPLKDEAGSKPLRKRGRPSRNATPLHANFARSSPKKTPRNAELRETPKKSANTAHCLISKMPSSLAQDLAASTSEVNKIDNAKNRRNMESHSPATLPLRLDFTAPTLLPRKIGAKNVVEASSQRTSPQLFSREASRSRISSPGTLDLRYDSAYLSSDSLEYTEDVASDEASQALVADNDTSILDTSAMENEGFSMVSIESLRSERKKAELQAKMLELEFKRVHAISNVTQEKHPAHESRFLPIDQDQAAEVVSETGYQPEGSSVKQIDKNTSLVASKQGGPVQRRPLSNRFDPYDPQVSLSHSMNNFLGFGDRTQRELRAGLIVGELLARADPYLASVVKDVEHQGSSEVCPQRLPTPSDSVMYRDGLTSQHTSDGNCTNQAELSTTEYDKMSWQPTNQDLHLQESTGSLHCMNLSPATKHAPRHDLIESYDLMSWRPLTPLNSLEDGTGETERSKKDLQSHAIDQDIWQEEADRSLEAFSASIRMNTVQSDEYINVDQMPELKDLFAPDVRPPRSKLPRTWRRTSGNDFLYSDEIVETPPTNVPAIQNPREHSICHLTHSQFSHKSSALITAEGAVRDTELSLDPPTNYEDSKAQQLQEFNLASKSTSNPSENVFVSNDQLYYSSEDSRSSKDTTPDESLSLEADDQSSLIAKGNKDKIGIASNFCDKTFDTPNNHTEGAMYEDSEISIHTRNGSSTGDLDSASFCRERSAPMITKKSELCAGISLKPQKVYPRLFELDALPTQPHNSNSYLEEGRNEKRRRLVDGTFSKVSGVSTPEVQQGILSRLTSWLFPTRPIIQNSSKWNRNHWLLLNTYYKASLASNEVGGNEEKVERRGSKLPETYFKPIPSELLRFVNYKLVTSGNYWPGRYRTIMTESDVRVAHAFIVEAREHGTPQLCDGKTDEPEVISKGKRKHAEFIVDDPILDKDGNVLRIREIWPPFVVVKKVFALWVGQRIREDEARGMI